MNATPISRIQVAVAHPDPLLALGLVAVLGQQPGIDVWESGHERSDASSADVVLTDYVGGLGMADLLNRGRYPTERSARILVLASQGREQEVRVALERGVHGYLLTGGRAEDVVEGIRALAQGQRYLSLAVAQRMADSMSRENLTTRESSVLGFLVQGCCNKTIAKHLDIAVGTVKAHVKGIMSKLHASSRTQVVSIAVERGLVAEERSHTSTRDLMNQRPSMYS